MGMDVKQRQEMSQMGLEPKWVFVTTNKSKVDQMVRLCFAGSDRCVPLGRAGILNLECCFVHFVV